ncbi:putative smpdl3a protein [Paratrimastix pyriformis]|uniref:Smpdl3a protein n=1 Tax=Paratrimastix pyriformis TaxID=342808 RepID=A0ABQ8UI12_9EUKA|nr:putative smpdl3a protein [Paratrimastix pyriformis]
MRFAVLTCFVLVSLASTYSVWQLTDIHVDPDYSIGADPAKGCHPPSPAKLPNGAEVCGRFGNTKAYSPVALVESTLDFVNSLRGKDDVIVHTGDVSWYTQTIGKADEMYGLKQLATVMHGAFPDTKVYPSTGNHDTWPCDILGNPEGVSKWVIDDYMDAWQAILGKEELEQARYAGYYVAIPRPGVMLISLNSVYFHQDNLLVTGHLDGGAHDKQLGWFEKSLAAAEQSNMTVWIISHVPFGFHEDLHDGEIQWGPQLTFLNTTQKYISLMQRYGDRVALQVYGHQHSSGYRLVHQADGKNLAAIQFVAPSVTPHVGKYPSMWRYLMDDQTNRLVGIEQWFVNLTLANQDGGRATWELQARWPQDFGMADLELDSWQKYTERMRTDPAFLMKVRRLALANYDDGKTCDDDCRQQLLCATLYTEPALYEPCIKVKPKA